MEQINYSFLHKQICNSKHIVFLGGAGVSTSSNIPDFRSKDGLYNVKNKYGVSYEELLSLSYFYSHTKEFYDFYWNNMVHKEAKPNKAHLALAEFEKSHDISIITQNIDGLHQKAGSKKVYQAHGTIWSYHCLRCHKKYDLDEIDNKGIPFCSCGGLIKPDVTLYEESLNEEVLSKSLELVSHADCLLVAGTSLLVYPIAGLVDYFSGKLSILINESQTPKDNEFDYVIRGDVGDNLEKLLLGKNI